MRADSTDEEIHNFKITSHDIETIIITYQLMTNMQLLYGKLSTQLCTVHYSKRLPLWLIRTDLFYKFKIYTGFRRLSIKKGKISQ